MSTTEPISIYHIEGRRSFRVVWLREQLLPTPGSIPASIRKSGAGRNKSSRGPRSSRQGEMQTRAGRMNLDSH
jgi:hypothetical protein